VTREDGFDVYEGEGVGGCVEDLGGRLVCCLRQEGKR
jgi:hypothetical protein